MYLSYQLYITFTQGYYDTYRPAFNTSQSFYTDDGRLVVRERGCPELHVGQSFSFKYSTINIPPQLVFRIRFRNDPFDNLSLSFCLSLSLSLSLCLSLCLSLYFFLSLSFSLSLSLSLSLSRCISRHYTMSSLKVETCYSRNTSSLYCQSTVTHFLIHHFETVSKKLQTITEMCLLKDFLDTQIALKNIVEKGEIAHFEQCHLLPQCFP